MLRRLTTLTVAVAWVACGSASVWGQVNLSLKYPDNTEAVTQTTAKTKQTLTIAGMDVETSNEAFIVSRSKSGTRSTEGVLVTEDKIDTLQTTLKVQGQEVQFDSGNPDKKADNALLEPVLDMFRATYRMTPRTHRDKDNKVVKVEFPEEEFNKLSDAVKKEFDAEKRKEQAQQETAFLPGKAVKMGDTWEHTSTTSLGGGQTMEFGNEYTYAGTVKEGDKTLHKITSKTKTVKYMLDPNAETPLKVTASELKPTESAGEILIDLEQGQVTKTTNKIRIQGDMSLSIGGMNLPGKLDLTIETESKLQP